jgi:hypothetical protein
VVIRTGEQRAKAALEANQKSFQQYVEKARRESAADAEQWRQVSAVNTAKIAALEKEVKSLRRRNLNLRASGGVIPSSYRNPRKSHGGTSLNTRNKYQNEIKGFLVERFATKEARQQALYEHFKAYPEDYCLVTNRDISLADFEELCRLNPTWLHPVQRDVVKKIEDFWSTSKCLSIQIHCKLGYGGKWQDLINITRKSFNIETGKWDLNELYEGSKIYPPSFKSKWAVNEFRAEIRREIPIMQDKTGTAAWFELPKLVEESIWDERREGYLQGRKDKPEDEIRLHWGGDAAQYFRGIKTTRVGYRLPDAAKVVQNDPRQYRSVLQFEGKDDYASLKEYLQPMFPVMDVYSEERIAIDGTHYTIKQSLGGDNVFLAEACRHSGHSTTMVASFVMLRRSTLEESSPMLRGRGYQCNSTRGPSNKEDPRTSFCRSSQASKSGAWRGVPLLPCHIPQPSSRGRPSQSRNQSRTHRLRHQAPQRDPVWHTTLVQVLLHRNIHVHPPLPTPTGCNHLSEDH